MSARRRAALLLWALLATGALGLESTAYIEDTDRFPGWRGELPSSVVSVRAPDGTQSVGFGEGGRELWRGRIEQVSWKPRAFLFHDFLTDAECEHLKALARASLEASTVVDNETGKSVPSTVRTSSGTFLASRQDDIVAAIERRLAHVTMIPEENGESLQILKYVDGQKYEPHTDSFHDKFNADDSHGGQRVATVLMYLATPEEGGETVFPYAPSRPAPEGWAWSECAAKGLAVRATKGSALLFYSLRPDGTEDVASTHGSCPTTRGEKWSATKWIHVKAFNTGGGGGRAAAPKGGCADNNERCEDWAATGECDANPAYMRSECRKACGKCTPGLLSGISRKFGGSGKRG